MPQVKKYYYNTATQQYEKYKPSLKSNIFRLVGMVSAFAVSLAIIIALSFYLLDSPKEKLLNSHVETLEEKYNGLVDEYNDLNKRMLALEQKDDQVYRSIFEAAPLRDSFSIHLEKMQQKTEGIRSTAALANQIISVTQKLKHRMSVQTKSLDTIEHFIEAKEQMFASIPAIIPISYKLLASVASGFGYRIDPVYKTPKLHAGIDFAAHTGTPIYATANGTVKSSSYDEAGYGNFIIINHGYGYETLYGHMIKAHARPGQTVKRGQVIGYVGSTGKSTGPHVHYEVIKNGEKINPVHFFYNDLSPTDYDKIIQQAGIQNQSFD